MDNYSKDILSLTKKHFTKTVGAKTFQTSSEARSYYLEDLNDNLYMPMDDVAKHAYGHGTGNEIASGKMNALRSSSALTYNLFWNRTAKFNAKSSRIGQGSYSVEFEKQYRTLKPSVPGLPANLDAFLYCKDTAEAVACEMKMMEWIFNKPGNLRSNYLSPENYINGDAGKTFTAIAKSLTADTYDKTVAPAEYPCRMTRYDAFQMFKHAVACYSACASEEPRKIQKLTLANCVWTLSTPEALEQKHCEKYLKDSECEHREFESFKQAMQPAKKLFSDIGVDFDICFYSFNDFLSLLDKDAAELNYLSRYTFR